MKLVIGLVGEKGGGKGSFYSILKELLPDKKIDRISSSELLARTLDLWALARTRENFIKLVKTMNEGFGEGAVTKALAAQIETSGADMVIIDSIRLKSDLNMLRSFPNNLLLYITADPKIRYERSRARGEKAGEQTMSFEQFSDEEKAHTEQLIPEFGKQADFVINNNATIDQFKEKINQFTHNHLLR